jgi:hypothetical protein
MNNNSFERIFNDSGQNFKGNSPAVPKQVDMIPDILSLHQNSGQPQRLIMASSSRNMVAFKQYSPSQVSSCQAIDKTDSIRQLPEVWRNTALQAPDKRTNRFGMEYTNSSYQNMGGSQMH